MNVSAVVVPVSTLTSMPYANLLAQTISEINSTEINGGRRGPFTYDLPVNVIAYLRLLALSVLTCSLNISFRAQLVLDNTASLEKLELGHRPAQLLLRKNFLREV